MVPSPAGAFSFPARPALPPHGMTSIADPAAASRHPWPLRRIYHPSLRGAFDALIGCPASDPASAGRRCHRYAVRAKVTAGRYVTSNNKYKDMEIKEGATAESFRYVELAPRPMLPLIEQTAQAVEQLQDIKAARKEHFVALYLNARYELLRKELVSIGTVDASLVHPRDVFAPALMHNATAVIVAHNHPSGDATPSAEDREVTQRLKEGGRLLGIAMLEHIIITEYGYSTL